MGKEHMEEILTAVAADCPKIYSNGFTVALGMGDVVVAFQQNGRPAAVLNLSFTVAKTLNARLSKLIMDLEDNTGQTIMTTDQIIKSLNVDEQENS